MGFFTRFFGVFGAMWPQAAVLDPGALVSPGKFWRFLCVRWTSAVEQIGPSSVLVGERALHTQILRYLVPLW